MIAVHCTGSYNAHLYGKCTHTLMHRHFIIATEGYVTEACTLPGHIHLPYIVQGIYVESIVHTHAIHGQLGHIHATLKPSEWVAYL